MILLSLYKFKIVIFIKWEYFRLFAKQIEFEDALTTIAERNKEHSALLEQIMELEKRVLKQESEHLRYGIIYTNYQS